MLYVKIGGSLITPKKEGRREVREEIIREISRDLNDVIGDFKIFLAHGAGPYGHDPVLKYRLHFGMSEANRRGASETMVSVSELNLAVARIMSEEGIYVAPFPARAVFMRERGMVKCQIPQIKEIMNSGFVPLTHGDLIPDTERGIYVLSADEIPLYLTGLGLRRAIYLIDLPGVLDEEGRVIPTVRREDLGSVTGIASSDATGSIRGKLERAFELAEMGIDVRIAGYRGRGDLINALTGKTGTRVLP
ncbi:MAG: isopentenyl phosphate kinase [Candidatus Korarchaeum sp.]